MEKKNVKVNPCFYRASSEVSFWLNVMITYSRPEHRAKIESAIKQVYDVLDEIYERK